MSSPAEPSVAVLLATHNGLRWIAEQVDSILAQRGVAVRIIALDDASTDGTDRWLAERAADDDRVTVLPAMGASGGAAANFLRLVEHAQFAPGELVAFADQDDLWHPGKLERHARLLDELGVAAVSSSVMAFTEEGERHLVKKDFPQRDFDFLAESPGPGCTFLMTPALVAAVRETLAEHRDLIARIDFHDSLVYAVARAKGWTWHIDGEPTVDYRQHDSNVFGSNTGARSAITRLRLMG